jgi:hypothetical protein
MSLYLSLYIYIYIYIGAVEGLTRPVGGGHISFELGEQALYIFIIYLFKRGGVTYTPGGVDRREPTMMPSLSAMLMATSATHMYLRRPCVGEGSKEVSDGTEAS